MSARRPSKVRVAIAAARHIAEAYGQDQVVVVTFDKRRGLTHVVTYGRTLEECEQAAQGGNRVRKALGWPASLCKATPARVVRAKRRRACQQAVRCALCRKLIGSKPYTFLDGRALHSYSEDCGGGESAVEGDF